jgi:two-component system, OmpR family, response regulator MprA
MPISKTKILVVDDEDCIRNLVQTTLNRDGRHVLLAAGGKDAIAVFRRERPDITILDLDMPDIDGLAVLRQIREIRPSATVFIFTGTDNPEAERQARKLGVEEFLKKGFALPTLAEIETRAQKRTNLIVSPSAGSSWWKWKG